jgi:hypothetical protein
MHFLIRVAMMLCTLSTLQAIVNAHFTMLTAPVESFPLCHGRLSTRWSYLGKRVQDSANLSPLYAELVAAAIVHHRTSVMVFAYHAATCSFYIVTFLFDGAVHLHFTSKVASHLLVVDSKDVLSEKYAVGVVWLAW